MSIDTAAVRERFPALERAIDGIPVAYFDGPGGTQVPREVVDAMADYLYHHNANTKWMYPPSVETDAIIAGAREALADLLNARPSEVVFGQNMTSLTFHLGRALGRGWGAGDEVVVTELDHHANVAPWRALEQERGVTIRMAPAKEREGVLDLDALASLIGPRTKLVAIGAASNALGTINDVARVAEMARAAGALTFVDAVHYAPHALVDVRAIGCDFLACSAYKFYGPHVGVLFGRHDLLQSLDVPKLLPAPDSAPDRLETGTQNHEGIVGAAAAVNFLAALGTGTSRRDRLASAFSRLHGEGRALLTRLWDGLSAVAGVRLYGPPPTAPRTPTVSFTVADRNPAEVTAKLVERGVFVSHGDFYASTVVERMGQGTHGMVRAGCACYTTADEVDRLVEGVAALARRQST